MRRVFRKRTISAVALAATAALVVGFTARAAFFTQSMRKILPIDLRPQEKSDWCWAATSQMVMEFSGRNGVQNVTQCRQATVKLSLPTGSDCCSSSLDCNVPGWPIFDQFHFNSAQTDHSALSWDDLKREIDDGRPFCFTMQAQASILGRATGHMILVRGYEIDAQGQKWVHVFDPQPLPNPGHPNPVRQRGGEELSIRYDDYVENKTNFAVNDRWSGYTHWNDYFLVQPSSP